MFFNKDDEEILQQFEHLSKQNKELTSIMNNQQDLIQSIVKIIIESQKETETRLTNMHGEVAQLTNTLNGYIRSEINNKKVQTSNNFFF